MGRYTPSSSYGHWVKKASWGDYEIGWTYDRYFKGSRLRHPQSTSRFTDEAGARRFCKKWELEMPT